MAELIWRPDSGEYFSTSGVSSPNNSFCYYNRNRYWYFGFPRINNILGIDNKSIIHINNATFNLYISKAYNNTIYSAWQDIGYNYTTNSAYRRSLSGANTIRISDTEGWKTFDVTGMLRAFVSDKQGDSMILWGNGNGTNGSNNDTVFNGYSNSNSPYIRIEYELSNVKIYANQQWNSAIPYVWDNDEWKPTIPRINTSNAWK